MHSSLKQFERRLQRLEALLAEDQKRERFSRGWLQRLEDGRRRVRQMMASLYPDYAQSLSLQIPESLKQAARQAGIAPMLNLGRDRVWRTTLAKRCYAVTVALNRAQTEEDRAEAQRQSAELERRCQRYRYASSDAFVAELREQGWLPLISE